ncbi:TAXI family TRAP transporter solute-binding subunit [Candidatus Parabeggiatoa sp. HSG14]|uniref:TAXI family TRAP transporter solute-binding subunit n=1 Tax=Candidatus Parabeggiatoa sp. HSG14 TaxID=3055593 RepID=UPI0025A6C365|nr:TAXI family TRAP transporter solute-binding subunit [Thiotrichales bacterium HSG14]
MKCESCKVWMPIVVVILLSVIIAYQFVEPAPPGEIRIATGREGGGYHSFALKYQEQLAEQHLKLDIQPTAGSIEVLKLLKAGTVSVGIVQGGTGHTVSSENLESIASLFYEPLWVFYRRGLPIEYLFDLRGKRIAVGEVGSGTLPVAMTLLQDNKVTQNNTTLLNLSSKVAMAKLIANEIDAAFFIMSPTSSTISKLLTHPDIELLSFKRDEAYGSRYPFLTTVRLGEGVIDLENNVPRQDKVLLAATASLVARNDLHPDIIHLLLTTIIGIHKESGLLEKQDQFPSDKFVEFPMNKAAGQYLRHGPSWLYNIFSFWVASTLDRLKILLIPLVVIMLPLLKGALPLYRWGIRFKIFRWYGILREVDSKIHDLTDLKEIEEESKRIKALQKELIEQVSVPLSYMGEFYGLRMHMKLVLEQLDDQREEILGKK